MSGRNPPLYCTITLIAMQGHQKNIKSKPETMQYTITPGSSNIHYKGYKYKATTWYLTGFPTELAVTLGQQYNVGEKPTVVLYTYINHHAQPPIIPQHNHSKIHSYEYSPTIDNSTIKTYLVHDYCCSKVNQNAPRPSEHPQLGGKKCQNV